VPSMEGRPSRRRRISPWSEAEHRPLCYTAVERSGAGMSLHTRGRMSMSAVAAYVQQREGEYYVGESRVTVHSVIADWKRGAAPEDIVSAFPTLPLVAIYGTITYYLEHRAELDAHFRETGDILAVHQARVEAEHPQFFAKMRSRLAAYRSQHIERSPDQPSV